MIDEIPNSVIGAVSSVIAGHYYSHTKLNSLFMEFGAPGNAPEGNCETKCSKWFRRCNEDPSVDALSVLGQVIHKYMDLEPNSWDETIKEGQQRIVNALERNHLSYQLNGRIVLSGSSPTSKSLSEILNSGDFSSIEKEFERALEHVASDPHAAITAACSIIEALCKTYIETHGLNLPTKQTITPLWKVVQQHLGLNIDRKLEDDQKKMLQGLSSIVDGVGAFRTHIGSAHGRGIQPPPIIVSEARLAVNASHTVVLFVMEKWHETKYS